MATIKGIFYEASAFVKVKLINLKSSEMFLFYKGNLTIENISGNKQAFKATLHLDTTNSTNPDEIFRSYFDYNNGNM